ncbi:MAG: PrsW family glutamic-type intramembrane protease [Candidatus Limnocylindrales bacterium]
MTATFDPGSTAIPGALGPHAQPVPAATPPGASRWGKQASLIQPRQPAFWLYCAMLAIGGYLFVQEQLLMSSLLTAYLLSWALVLAYAVPVAFVIYRLDLFEREPMLLLAAAVVWGGVIATSLAAHANEAWLSILGKVASPEFAAQWGAAVVGPGVEETLKLMGVVTIFLIASSEFDGVMDGFVYGAMVGLGFTVVEDVSYFINAVAAAPGVVDQSGPVFDTFLIRVVGGGLYGHVLFTGLTGTGFAFFVTQRASAMPKRVIGAALCIAAGVSAHVVWNSPWMESILQTTGGENPSVIQWIEYGTLKGLPFLLLLGLLVVFATRSEENNYRSIVAGEPDPWVVTDEEIRSLRSLWARRQARSAVGRVRGSAGASATGRLQAAQIEYAMIRSRADSLSDPALGAQRLKIRSIRGQIAALPFVAVLAARPPVVAGAPAAQPAPGAPWHGVAPVGAPWRGVAPVGAPWQQPAAQKPIRQQPAPETAPPVTPALDVAAPEVEAGPEMAPASSDGTEVAAAVESDAPLAQPPEQAAPAPESESVAAAPETVVESPAPATEPEAPARAPVAAATYPAPIWAPTHFVPRGGMAAWDYPDPRRPPVAMLSERVELIVVGQAGAWAQVRGVNGWTGWVDGRLLIARR